MTRGTLTVRVRGVPFPIEFADWTHDRLYHTVEMEGGDAQEIQAFIGAQGSPIPGGTRTLTEVDTNIPRSGDTGLQEGWEMLVYSIQINITREMGRDATNKRRPLGRTGQSWLACQQFGLRSCPKHLGRRPGAVLFRWVAGPLCGVHGAARRVWRW